MDQRDAVLSRLSSLHRTMEKASTLMSQHIIESSVRLQSVLHATAQLTASEPPGRKQDKSAAVQRRPASAASAPVSRSTMVTSKHVAGKH